MADIGRSWRTRTDVDRADLATRWQLFAFSASEPLVVLLVVADASVHRNWAVVALLAFAVAHTVLCIALLTAAINRLHRGPSPRRWLLVTVLAGPFVAVGLSVAAFPGPGGGRVSTEAGAAMLTFAAGAIGAATPLLPVRVLPALVVVPATGLLAVQGLVQDLQHTLWAIYYVLVSTGAIITYATAVWFLGVMWELADSRDTQAQLAVAEERLRFSRDLHDVLGRNLALMAVNSELAAQLARRGDPLAVDHMLAVQQVAQDSVREVREVVSGYRAAALDVELAGAQSLLRATGIDVRLIGDGRDLPVAAQAALGWVVREAVTNIIRHSDPSRVTISLTSNASAVVLLISNDGVRAESADVGHGLVGLQERLATIDGVLTAESLPDKSFSLSVRLPLASEAVL
jgi:two-component system sensor histidine kinase DesK